MENKFTPMWITDPNGVWDDIKTFLQDDTKEIEENGTFMGVFDGAAMAGAFLFRAWNSYCYEVHGGVARKYWGRGSKVCDVAGRSFFHSTPCLKLVAVIPEFNKLMRKCVQDCGMKEEGVVKKAYMKRSQLHDLIIYGMTKGEMRCRRHLT